MLQIGSNPVKMNAEKKRQKKGFTLIEVIVAVAILSLGTVLIYEAFFVTLDAFNYCRDYLKVASRMDEKLWQAQNSLTTLGTLEGMNSSGGFDIENRHFDWKITYGVIQKHEGISLFRADIVLSMKRGRKSLNLT